MSATLLCVFLMKMEYSGLVTKLKVLNGFPRVIFFYPNANILVKLLKQDTILCIQYLTSLLLPQQFRIDSIYFVGR